MQSKKSERNLPLSYCLFAISLSFYILAFKMCHVRFYHERMPWETNTAILVVGLFLISISLLASLLKFRAQCVKL